MCHSVNTDEALYTQIWEEDGSGLEAGFRKLYFAATELITGKPVVTGKREFASSRIALYSINFSGSYILIKKDSKNKYDQTNDQERTSPSLDFSF